MGTNAGGNAYPVKESVVSWGVWCKDIPFVIHGKAKEPAKRTWYDQHGDDEYIPDDGLMLEAYTMKVEFGCKIMSATTDETTTPDTEIPAVEDVKEKVSSFLEYLRTSGMMKMYSSYTGIGRQNVRFSDVDDKAIWKSDEDGNEFLIFSVTFKVNDPVTDITLTA